MSISDNHPEVGTSHGKNFGVTGAGTLGVLPLTAAIRAALGRSNPAAKPATPATNPKQYFYDFETLKKILVAAFHTHLPQANEAFSIEMRAYVADHLAEPILQCKNLDQLVALIDNMIFEGSVVMEATNRSLTSEGKVDRTQLLIPTHDAMELFFKQSLEYLVSRGDVDTDREKVVSINTKRDPKVVSPGTRAYEAMVACKVYLNRRREYLQGQDDSQNQPDQTFEPPPLITLASLKKAMHDALDQRFASLKEALLPDDAGAIRADSEQSLHDEQNKITEIKDEIAKAIASTRTTDGLIRALQETQIFLLDSDYSINFYDPKTAAYLLFCETLKGGMQALTGTSVPPEDLSDEMRRAIPAKNWIMAQRLSVLHHAYHDAQEKQAMYGRSEEDQERYINLMGDALDAHQAIIAWLNDAPEISFAKGSMEQLVASALRGEGTRKHMHMLLEEEACNLTRKLSQLSTPKHDSELWESFVTESMFDSLIRDDDHVRAFLRNKLLAEFAELSQPTPPHDVPSNRIEAGEAVQLNPAESPLRTAMKAHQRMSDAFYNMEYILPLVCDDADKDTTVLRDLALSSQDSSTQFLEEQANSLLRDYVRDCLPKGAKISSIPVLALPVIHAAFELVRADYKHEHPTIDLSSQSAVTDLNPNIREGIVQRMHYIIDQLPPDGKDFMYDMKAMLAACNFIDAQTKLARNQGFHRSR